MAVEAARTLGATMFSHQAFLILSIGSIVAGLSNSGPTLAQVRAPGDCIVDAARVCMNSSLAAESRSLNMTPAKYCGALAEKFCKIEANSAGAVDASASKTTLGEAIGSPEKASSGTGAPSAVDNPNFSASPAPISGAMKRTFECRTSDECNEHIKFELLSASDAMAILVRSIGVSPDSSSRQKELLGFCSDAFNRKNASMAGRRVIDLSQSEHWVLWREVAGICTPLADETCRAHGGDSRISELCTRRRWLQ